ncbi:MAG: helicase-related protein [Armatimonadota bacterium]
MPRIFDNIKLPLLQTLRETLQIAYRADFCVGYFNLRGWKHLAPCIEHWKGGEGNCCRLLVGMQGPPEEEFRQAMSLLGGAGIDQGQVMRLKRRMAEEFREQLTLGVPTAEDEAGLRHLARQLRQRKLVVKLFLRHPLHAKLYLCFRDDVNSPIVGFVGSSNLTLAGLREQGELNVDVLDQDACQKLEDWFEDRWNDRWCLDITDELVKVIEESWAREELISPYHIYIKIAYHLSQEARTGLSEFRIPKDFGNKLLDFQTAAVKIAAHHLHKRGGVLIGDVVGLGKTLMATALARIFEDDFGLETLIICPKNLVKMWEDYRQQYRLRATVLSITRVIEELPNLRRHRLVLIDESQNLRNREGKRYRAIRDYIERNESLCILLSATPYNKTYLDLSNQLRLFVPEDKDLGIRPEQYIRRDCQNSEVIFRQKHDCPVRSLAAFEKSNYADDWRDLMRLYMVRRTRTFIQQNYAQVDSQTGRKYLTFEDGTRSYFPTRVPQTLKFDIDAQYERLYSQEVVNCISALNLPRYGLGNYVAPNPQKPPSNEEAQILKDLSRAGKRLMGFCRTNLFKRLESSGFAFIQSVERHILRNYLFLHALENGLPLPIGAQSAEMLDSRFTDEDADDIEILIDALEEDEGNDTAIFTRTLLRTEQQFRQRAAEVYNAYRKKFAGRFKWLSPHLFVPELEHHLRQDAAVLLNLLQQSGEWDPAQDAKLQALHKLLTERHPEEKVIIFSQFADTVYYLEKELKARGVTKLAGVTGQSDDPTEIAWRFSPESNNKRERIAPENELRVLIATDVLSEGQNLQDCAIVVNYDLPWAIIRLVQRAGRVDRIGQKSERILVYSFLPAEGVERVIRLRERVRKRLQENAEVVGTDEAFFEDDHDTQILDLYHEKAGILDGEEDADVDLASYAYQIWKNAVDADPRLKEIIPNMPNVVYATRPLPDPNAPEGVLVYLRTADDNDALAWVDLQGKSITESQFEILKAAECTPDTPALPRLEQHHDLVRKGVETMLNAERGVGVQLGRPSSAKYRTYERLMRYARSVQGTVFDTPELHRAIEELSKYPLYESAKDILNSHLRTGISDEKLVDLVLSLRSEDRLCIVHEEAISREPRIICSMGLRRQEE